MVLPSLVGDIFQGWWVWPNAIPFRVAREVPVVGRDSRGSDPESEDQQREATTPARGE